METAVRQLVAECKRQSEACLYTSTSLFVWLRVLRWVRIGFVIANVTLGGLAGLSVFKAATDPTFRAWGIVFALLAGILPAIYAALRADEGLHQCAALAGEFKNLQDRFRQAALSESSKPFAEFERVLQGLMDRLERARAGSYTAPEWCFRLAQRKIRKGDYAFHVDVQHEQPG